MLPACGYQFANRVNTLPSHIKKVGIEMFQNQTDEPNLESVFFQAFQQEFSTDRRLALTSTEKADAVLKGRVKQIALTALAYDAAGYPSKYRSTVTLDLTLFDQVRNEVYWQAEDYSRSEEYAVGTSVGESEGKEVVLYRKLAEDLARSVHRDIIAKF